MSSVPVADDGDDACANCGKHGSDAVILKNCTACRLVVNCGVDCQRAHHKQHKKACKQRAAELKDEQLYSRGLERLEGDFCPICTLPFPIPIQKHSVLNICCTKRVCFGCHLAVQKKGMFDCAFCRAPFAVNPAHQLATIRARVKKKDPEAIHLLGQQYFRGELGLQQDLQKGIELWTMAAELGSIHALYSLGVAYSHGDGVEKDEGKCIHYYEKAAMQGHVESRYTLGSHETREGNDDRALKHYLISARMGHKESVEPIKTMFMGGLATKAQYAQALKGYQAAVEEAKSHDRDEATTWLRG